jgi:pilus assembly protein CpaF
MSRGPTTLDPGAFPGADPDPDQAPELALTRGRAWPRLTPPVWRADPGFSGDVGAAPEFDLATGSPGADLQTPWDAHWLGDRQGERGDEARDGRQEARRHDDAAAPARHGAAAVSSATIAALAEQVQERLSALHGDLHGASDADLGVAVADALSDEGIVLPAPAFTAVVRAVRDELTGLGPIAPLLADPSVTDVMINGPDDIWVERDGRLQRTPVHLASHAALSALIQRVVAPLGLRVDEARPWVDARLPSGERFHAVLPPLAPDGPVVTIRTFARQRLTLADLVERGTLDATTGRLLEAMVRAGIAIVASGATGTGKTTLLNVLASAIPPDERVVTIEDAAELSLRQPHVVRLEARPPNVEGCGEVTMRELVRNALRMRPDRIVVGEARGPEVMDLLQAANTGHRGLLATIHAASPADVPARLEALALSAPGTVLDVVRRLIAGGIEAVVHLERTPAGRRITAVAALAPDPYGQAQARLLRVAGPEGLHGTGYMPAWADRLDPAVLDAFEPPASGDRVRMLSARRGGGRR